MRAVICRTHGPPELLDVVEQENPRAGAREVIVEVAAAAVNFPDLLIMADRYQVSLPTPFIPGSEFAGVVIEVGEEVAALSVGDRVRGTTFHGAFAERVAIDADRLALVPEGVDLVEAAAFFVTHATAHHCLRSVAELAAGERLLVLGAAGGVGSAAVALGVAMGADVVAVASSEDKLAVCRSLGADIVVDGRSDDLRDAFRTAVPDGVDVVIDPVGGSQSEAAVRACRWGARFVTVGFASGEIPAIPLNLVLLKGVSLMGFEMRGFAEHRGDALERDRLELEELFVSGRVRPLIGATFPLEDAPAALQSVADRTAVGKVLLVP
jgi:NADPH2:quinone reductase